MQTTKRPRTIPTSADASSGAVVDWEAVRAEFDEIWQQATVLNATRRMPRPPLRPPPLPPPPSPPPETPETVKSAICLKPREPSCRGGRLPKTVSTFTLFRQATFTLSVRRQLRLCEKGGMPRQSSLGRTWALLWRITSQRGSSQSLSRRRPSRRRRH